MTDLSRRSFLRTTSLAAGAVAATRVAAPARAAAAGANEAIRIGIIDRKSTRLNSSH